MANQLLLGIVGYSTRSLVQAVTDLGHRAIAIDAFGDQDTIDMAEAVHVVDDWPRGIMNAARATHVDGWLLAGGMENCEELLESRSRSTADRLCELARVLGPDLDQMQTLRSLNYLESVCRDGVHWPTTCLSRPEDDLSNWLMKPFHSAGGLFIQSACAARDETCSGCEHYWQRRITGRVLGVTWILHDEYCQLLGVTESLSATDWPGPSEFIYRGSVGPIAIRDFQHDALVALGERVKASLPGYRGYLQADLIADSNGRLWLLEFNPRWTAGMEVLHEAAPTPAATPLAAHLLAWGFAPSETITWDRPETSLVTKAIYYSHADVQLDQVTRRSLQSLRSWQKSPDPNAQWCVADLPQVTNCAPMRFETGRPILTLKCRMMAAK